MRKYLPTTVYLYGNQHARLKEIAQQRGISLGALMREITTDMIERKNETGSEHKA